MATRRTYDTNEFWDGCDQHELRIMRCQDCGAWIHHPRRVCPSCWSDNVVAEAIDGSATLVAYSLPRVMDPNRTPVVTAVVELAAAAGVRMTAQLVDASVATIEIGSPLELVWGSEESQSVPQFRVRAVDA